MGNCCKKKKSKNQLEESIIRIEGDEPNDLEDSLEVKIIKNEERKIKKEEILKRQEKERKNILNEEINKSQTKIKKEEKVKEVLEDMCVLGEIMKEEIIEEKKTHPENFISIEEAIQQKNDDSKVFCLGVLAQNLENIGMEIAIEKNPSKDEENNNESGTVLEFLTNGMIEKKKFNFHFDFGEERNEQLLNDKNEQTKFNNKLKQKLSMEYNIPEEKIILTNPQRGSYQVQVIFESHSFNKDSLKTFKEKCKTDENYKELCKLKEIEEKVIMEGCKLSTGMLDERGNRSEGWGIGEKRGGLEYYPPIDWIGYGLKVLDIYDGGNNDWLEYNGNKNEWAVAYHGIGRWGNAENITKEILKDKFLAGSNQAYEHNDDANHPGKKVGRGVYCSPKPKIMDEYAGNSSTSVNGKTYKMGFMMRVKPDKIRYSKNKPDYWVLNGTKDEMRPYRIMLKECN